MRNADEAATLHSLYQECQAMPSRMPPSPRLTRSLFSTPQPNGVPVSPSAMQMTVAEHERRVQDILGPLNRNI
eukprot:6036250-Lingulodinium_polyedra.AAC.1